MIARHLRLCGLALALATPACGADSHEVSVVVGAGQDGLHGFLCKQDADPSKLLVDRVTQRKIASLVFDFVDLGGVPGCRSSQLVAWCASHDCRPIRRVCVDLDLTTITPGSMLGAFDQVIEHLSGQVLATNAPDQPVLIRAIGVAGPCREVPAVDAADARIPCGDLFGCVYSCPVELDQVSDQILLDLDVFGDRCEQAVDVCANALDAQATCP